MLDVQDLLVAESIEKPVIVGTSRGGLVTMALAAAQPNAIGAVVLNDIGPIIEQEGLTRIAAYVGSVPLPRSWEEATSLVISMNRRAFPAVPEQQWAEVARQWFNEADGKPAPAYDPGIAQSVAVRDGPVPELWDLFSGLSNYPLLVLRGEKSDILSAATVEEMRSRHRDFASFTVAGQGHAPLLKEAESIGAIQRFLAGIEAKRVVTR
jgi:pimeloyl-ACP methyl ester carboxylesterase